MTTRNVFENVKIVKIRNIPSRINSTLSPWSKEGYNKIHQPVGKSIKPPHKSYHIMHIVQRDEPWILYS